MSVIKKFKSEIIKSWEIRVKKAIPSAAEQSQMGLYDSIPDYLDNLSKLLSPADAVQKEVAEVKEDLIGKVHGQHRAISSYSIEQMIEEYFILKDVVLEVLERENQLTLSASLVINNSIQKAIQISATQFSKAVQDAQEHFVTTLAHDLRSPLSVVKIHAQILARAKEQNLPQTSDRIIRSVNRIDNLIKDLLDTVTTRKRGLNELEFLQCDFLDIAKMVIREYQESSEAIFVLKGSPARGFFAARAIERVIDNLLSNALKYGDLKQPIEVTLNSDEKLAYFSVHNFGECIQPDKLINIFNKFQRSSNSNYQEGWGIGLSLVKSVVEAHGGTVLVNSDAKGTAFKIEIPLERMKLLDKTS